MMLEEIRIRDEAEGDAKEMRAMLSSSGFGRTRAWARGAGGFCLSWEAGGDEMVHRHGPITMRGLAGGRRASGWLSGPEKAH